VLNDVSDERGLAEFKRELSFLTRLRHRHIVQFIGASTAPPNLCLIMDYCDKGSLYAYLHNPNKALSAFKVLKWMSEAAKGLVYLHASDIIHRDVKSGNLFIDDGGSIKLGDFGLSKLHTGASTSGGMMSVVGTYQFMAPELLEGQPRYTTAVDVYSFAVVMWECLTREEPFTGLSPMQIVAALLRGERPSLDDASTFAVRLPDEYAAIVARCWQADAGARPTMEDIAPELERMFFAEKRLVIESKKRTVAAAPSLMP
jgi:sterile alpha motif and leucine zipper-containing kinase AZK